MAVWSNNPDVDPVGACVGMNGVRVNTIVEELRGEKIDIINWDENPAILIENALSPAKVISVIADDDEKTAKVIVSGNRKRRTECKTGSKTDRIQDRYQE
jgi:N utilization substance protein A